jgi:hypothetical protein
MEEKNRKTFARNRDESVAIIGDQRRDYATKAPFAKKTWIEWQNNGLLARLQQKNWKFVEIVQGSLRVPPE